MLQELTIDNLAIIEHLELSFDSKMTVLTGETGAGKSIIIDAVGLLAGSRGSQEFIRKGSDRLKLQGQFLLSQNPKLINVLDELGIDHDEQTLIIQREIHRNGRNTIRINGTLVNATELKSVGSNLVDIQGQNEHQLLMQPEQHLTLLDEFAKDDIQTVKDDYFKQYDHYQKLKKTLTDKQQNEKQWAQRIDMFKFQVQEIEAANLVSGEEEQLNDQKQKLSHYQQIYTTLQNASTVLNGDENGSSIDGIADVMDQMSEISQYDKTFSHISESLTNAYYALQDVANEVSHEIDGLEFDENQLDEIETRLQTITDLKHKYGDSVEQILAYYDKIKAELDSMETFDENSANLEQQVNETEQKVIHDGQQLTTLRKKAAEKLAKQIHQQLKELYMDKAVFEVKFLPHEQAFFANGMDQVEFYIQTNPGESMGPLGKIASGGELSRVMLALKTIFAQSQNITSIIFDEVDTGVSGRVAQAMAEKISMISKHSQVLCITHLPQVAAIANHHMLITKQINDGRTTTDVTLLSTEARVKELARMLSGSTVTKLTLQHASELLEMAQKN
ncbi:DNA repair protein RecN [Paucilactobacillus sp. N302-9]